MDSVLETVMMISMMQIDRAMPSLDSLLSMDAKQLKSCVDTFNSYMKDEKFRKGLEFLPKSYRDNLEKTEYIMRLRMNELNGATP